MAQQRHEDSDDDTYVRIGAAFERLETEEDVQKAKARKDKESYVTDEQGRRRFHGAFTGGFSAGYFNTVGSKEGWTPSSFVSSRVKKAEYARQKPEDFMDQEDFDVHGIAPRAVSTKDEFSQSRQQGVKRAAGDIHHDVIPGQSALQSLIVPAHSTIGAQLLKALGWKEGEGLGPKVMKYGPRQEMKTYGCSLPGEGGQPEPHGVPEEAKGFMFAPKDTVPWQFEGKDDLHGISYSGMKEQSVLASAKATKALYGMSGEAFGIGALEEDETEDDVYGVESMTSYDLTLAGEGDISSERTYGWTGSRGTDIWELSAFAKASEQSVPSKSYPPPNVPRDFVPKHKFSSASCVSGGQAEAQQRHKPLTSTERSQLLSDQPGSVFSLLSAEDREKLKRASASAKQTQSGQTTTSTPKMETLSIPETSSNVKDLSFDGNKLFANDPAKQERYKAFLAGKDIQDSGNRTEWERQREREEFARTAHVVQPLGSSLTSRFTRGNNNVTSAEELTEQEPESDAVQAAKADMFGVLTRQVEEWHPHRILCKRFNIPDPYPGSSLIGVASAVNEVKFSSKASGSVRSISFMHTERLVPVDDSAGADTDQAPAEQEPHSQQMAEELKDNSEKDVEDQLEESVEASRPSLDLFKAIFAESSDESAISSDEGEEDTTTSVPEPSSRPNDTKSHIQPNQSGRQWQDLSSVTSAHDSKGTMPSLPTTQSLSTNNENKERLSPLTEDTRHKHQPPESYGPVLPPGPVSDECEYGTRELRPEKRQRHHHTKKSHRKKEEHKKKRHKHSKHKR